MRKYRSTRSQMFWYKSTGKYPRRSPTIVKLQDLSLERYCNKSLPQLFQYETAFLQNTPGQLKVQGESAFLKNSLSKNNFNLFSLR